MKYLCRLNRCKVLRNVVRRAAGGHIALIHARAPRAGERLAETGIHRGSHLFDGLSRNATDSIMERAAGRGLSRRDAR